jgi:hypothetical protein
VPSVGRAAATTQRAEILANRGQGRIRPLTLPRGRSQGQGRTWYHAVLDNRGGDAYPAFSGLLFFIFGGLPVGLDAKGHQSTAFTWYLPEVSAPIARYVTSCGVDEHPPI